MIKKKLFFYSMISVAVLVLLILPFNYAKRKIFRLAPYTETLNESNYYALDVLDNEVLSKGKEELQKHKLLVLGITRDNSGALSHVIQRIENLGKEFKDYKVVLFENDSKDGTKFTLWLWKLLNWNVTILNEDFNIKKRPDIKFMANARNKYLDYINGEYPEYDIVLILDMDMKNGWDERGIYDSFAKISDWDVVCGNGLFTKDGEYGHMYDAFAFRSDEFPHGPEQDNYWTDLVLKVQKKYLPGTQMVPVKSCFNGMAFYKRKSMDRKCVYDSMRYSSSYFNEECEHVIYH